MMESEEKPADSSAPTPSTEPATERPLPPLPDVRPKRLHQGTLVVAFWDSFRQIVIPVLFFYFFGKSDRIFWFVGALGSLPLVIALVRYYSFSYRLDAHGLSTRSGLIEKKERHIPYERIQDLRFEQGIFHRLLNVVDVHVETAGGSGSEASLSVLSRADAEKLRAVIFENKAYQAQPIEPLADAPAGVPVVAAPTEEILQKISMREIIIAGLTSSKIASILVFLAAIYGLVDDFIADEYRNMVTEFVGNVVKHAGEIPITTYLKAAVIVMVIGTVFSVLGAILLFYGFTLTKKGEDLHRVYGLLTRRSSSLPRKRIQVVKIEEGLIRRRLGFATVKADSAGGVGAGNQNNTGRDVLLPIVKRDRAEELLPFFLPRYGKGTGEWQKMAQCAIRRGTFKGVVMFLILGAALAMLKTNLWFLLVPAAAFPLVYFINVKNYLNLGFRRDEDIFLTRVGWISRSTQLVPVRNVQMVVLKQSFFDRKYRVTSIHVDTAGQAYTGGGPRISNVLITDAEAVARALARDAAEVNFRW